MDINELLREEIRSELERLKDEEPGSESYKTTVDGIVKLTDRAIELTKLENQCNDKVMERVTAKKAAEIEQNFKTKQIEEERKDRIVKNCIAVAGVLLPSMITIWGTVKSFEFEKEGTITTMMGRGFINKLLPKK